MAARRALITGITGMVGSHLAEFLLDKTDWDVVGMAKGPSSALARRDRVGDAL